jgi:hypothetical protein
MKNTLLALMLSMTTATISAQSNYTLLFDTDKSALTPESRAALDRVIALVGHQPQATITIVGHTDSDGSHTYNERLSERRAQAAVLYLTEHNIHPDRIRISWLGETRPVTQDADRKGMNRRVEVSVSGPRDEPSPLRCIVAPLFFEQKGWFLMPTRAGHLESPNGRSRYWAKTSNRRPWTQQCAAAATSGPFYNFSNLLIVVPDSETSARR